MRGHVRARGKKYVIVVDIGRDEVTGKRNQKWFSGYDKKKDAERALPDILKKLQDGPYIEPANETVGELLKNYLVEKKKSVKPATWTSYAWLVNTHAIPNLGKIQVLKLKEEHLHDLYHNKLFPSLSAASIKKLNVIISAVLEKARVRGKIPLNVAEGVDLPKGKKAKFDVWTEEQLELFLEEARKDPYFLAFELAASTGMRKSEILGLRRVDVDLDKKRVSVRQALTKSESGYEIDDTKNNSSVRSIALFEDTVAYLKKHLDKQDRERSAAGYDDHGLLLQTGNGTPLSQRNLLRNFYRINRAIIRNQERLQAAGKPAVDFFQIRFHDLRHTHATILLKNGTHPKIVQERLGHSSIMVTLNTYSHVIPNMQEAVLAGIGSSITGGKGKAFKSLGASPSDKDEVRPTIAVEYEPFKPETYRGISVNHKGETKIVFSGDFYRDYGQALLEFPNPIQLPSVFHFMEDVKR